MFKTTATQEWSYQDVADICITALEGGSNYWLNMLDSPMPFKEPLTWQAVKTGLILEVQAHLLEEDDDVLEAKRRKVSSGDVVIALQALSDRGVDNQDHDANDADVFLQTLLLGEIIYG